MISAVADGLVVVLLVLGALLGLVAAVGILRLPDVLSRMHATTKPATLGLVLLLLAAAIHLDSLADSILVLLVIVFQFVTAPAAMHLVGRAAYRSGVRLGLTVDDLAGTDEVPDDVEGRAAERPDRGSPFRRRGHPA